jgi:hypothetical protein
MIMEFTFYPYTDKYVSQVEKRWGLYRLADELKKPVFIGKGNVQKHLQKHLPGSEYPADDAKFFSVEYFETQKDAEGAWKEALDEFKKKHGDLPRYNRK